MPDLGLSAQLSSTANCICPSCIVLELARDAELGAEHLKLLAMRILRQRYATTSWCLERPVEHDIIMGLNMP